MNPHRTVVAPGDSPRTKLLLVEDEHTLSRALAITLKTRHYDVQVAATGREALETASSWRPDVLIVDLGLPDIDGVDVVAALRAWTRTPVIVLSARTSPEEKVAALDAGADDYVTKPFSMEELLARLRAAIRRAEPVDVVTDATPAQVHTATFTIDLELHKVIRNGAEVRLTPTEWALLERLAKSVGRLIPGPVLLREVWGPQYEKENSYLRVYMGQLRRKLEDVPAKPRHLLTEAGMGYRLEP